MSFFQKQLVREPSDLRTVRLSRLPAPLCGRARLLWSSVLYHSLLTSPCLSKSGLYSATCMHTHARTHAHTHTHTHTARKPSSPEYLTVLRSPAFKGMLFLCFLLVGTGSQDYARDVESLITLLTFSEQHHGAIQT